MNLREIRKKKVLVKVDLGSANQFGLTLKGLIETVRILLQQGCGVCILPTYGPAFLKPGLSSKPFVSFFEKGLNQKLTWVEKLKGGPSLGELWLSENVFLDERELECDQSYIQELKSNFDVMVFDTLCNADGNYATSMGVIRENMPFTFGCRIQQLVKLKTLLTESKVGVILGGDNVASQLRFLNKRIENIKFVAIGGDIGLLMMGRKDTVYGNIKNNILSTVSLLRQHNVKILYPVDVIAYAPDSHKNRMCLFQDLEENEMVFDLGCQSTSRILSYVDEMELDVVIVSGTVGKSLDPRYSRGSETIIKNLVSRDVTRVIVGHKAILTAKRLSVLGAYDFIVEESTLNTRFLLENKTPDAYVRQFVQE